MPRRSNHYSPNYPATVAEVLDDSLTFRPACLRAMRRFRRSRPWHGSFEQRAAKLIALCADLAEAYGIRPPILRCLQLPAAAGLDCYVPAANTIHLCADATGHLSVVTFLHEFGHARGMDERDTCRWSVNLFRRVFPRSFDRLEQVGHRLLRVRLALHRRQAPSCAVVRRQAQQRVSVRVVTRPALPQTRKDR